MSDSFAKGAVSFEAYEALLNEYYASEYLLTYETSSHVEHDLMALRHYVDQLSMKHLGEPFYFDIATPSRES